MGRIAFVTDSTAGLPPDIVKKHAITVVPLHVMFGSESFRDGIDLSEREFFKRLKSAKTLPTSSQPTPAEFETAFRTLADDPEVDSIICVSISTGLSGTYNSSTQAANLVQSGTPKKITVIDSLSVYFGEGVQVVNGARAADEGKSHEEVVQLIESIVPRVRVLVLIDTLEYLHRGGRIGNATAFMGSLLNIKPILHVKDGKIEPLERVRTRRKGLERLAEIAYEDIDSTPCQICVGHAEAPEDMQTLLGLVRGKLNVSENFRSDLGPVISTHAGPGVLGFVYLPAEG